MGAGISFFEKNKIDLDLDDQITLTVTDAIASDNGQDFVDLLRNRNNRSGWGTTSSTDAANTTIVADMVDEKTIDHIFLIGHNLKAYTLKYWNGSSYVDFSTAVAETANVKETTVHSFDKVSTSRIQLIITGTMIANDDKLVKQLVITELIGQFTTGFKIEDSVLAQERRMIKMLSGKAKIIRNSGSFECVISKKNVINEGDLNTIESLFDRYSGFLVWLCGGDETQFRTQRRGYRKEDLFLMDAKSEYSPEWSGGFYEHGTDIKIKLVEVV